MIVKDYHCQTCNTTIEKLVDSSNIQEAISCPLCYGFANKIISMRNTDPVDSSWIGTVREVVNKSSKEPHCTEFLKHPTRQNYKNWMKGEGLRHLEKGESYLTKPDKESKLKEYKHKLKLKYRERNAISI
jgi:hypothetical protein